MVFCKDTDRDLLESDKQRNQNERKSLLAAVEQTSDSILITDQNRVIRYVNPRFEKLSGFLQKDVIGKKVDEIWHECVTKTFPDNLFSELDRSDSWKGRIIAKNKAGDFYETETTMTGVRDASENLMSYVVVNKDVTHEARLEKQLIQAQKMQAIGTLAGGIAHDFNNILSAIMGYTEICMLQTSENTQIPRRLSRVMHACQRARELVRQILTFSRQSHQDMFRVQIHLIIKEALKLLRAALPSTIEIRQKIHTDSGYIFADPIQIHQVLINLCTNAADAMGQNGGVLSVGLDSVIIGTGKIEKFRDLKPGDYVRLTVSDTGHGINTEIMNRIFDPFFTSQQSHENKGMGLAVVQSIVRNHGGAVYADSQPGKGSVFEVFLPRSTGELVQEKKSAVHLPGGNERILLLDDEEDIVQIAGEMLDSLGYTVKSTVRSLEALKWFDQAPDGFDLIVTDQTMPMMTGSELADRVTNIRPDIPVILCTGFSEDLMPGINESGHIRAIIMKPFIIQELALTIRKVLDNR